MGFDAAGEDFELDVAVTVDSDDKRHSGIGIVVPHDDVRTDLWGEPGSRVGRSRRDMVVVGHAHDVNGDVVFIPRRWL